MLHAQFELYFSEFGKLISSVLGIPISTVINLACIIHACQKYVQGSYITSGILAIKTAAIQLISDHTPPQDSQNQDYITDRRTIPTNFMSKWRSVNIGLVNKTKYPRDHKKKLNTTM